MKLIPLIAAALFAAAAAAQAPKALPPLPMPPALPSATPADIPDAEWLKAEHKSLSEVIGNYPPKIASAAQRDFIHKRWSRAIQKVWQLESAAPRDEGVMAVLADFYRLGHNLDVAGAAQRADEVLQRCLQAYPDSRACHFSAGYFYLSVSPAFVPKGEASLLRLREMFKPKVNAEVERGLVFAHVYLGRREEALKQVDYYLTLEPGAAWALQLREALLSGTVAVEQKP